MITTITRKDATHLMRMFISYITLRTIDWDFDDTSFGLIFNFLPWYIVQVESPPRAPLSRLPSEVRFSFPEVMITGIVGAPSALYCGCIRLGDQSYISAPSHSSPKGLCPLIGFQPILSTTLTEISSGTTCAITIMQCKPNTEDPHYLMESEALVLTVPLINFLNSSRSRLFVVKYQKLAVRMRVDIQMDKIDVKPPRVRSNARLSEQEVDLTSPCRWKSSSSLRSESYEESEVSSHSNSPTAFLSCGSSSVISSEDSSEQDSVSGRKSGLLRLRLWDSILPKIQLVRSTPSTEAFSIVVLPPQTPPAR